MPQYCRSQQVDEVGKAANSWVVRTQWKIGPGKEFTLTANSGCHQAIKFTGSLYEVGRLQMLRCVRRGDKNGWVVTVCRIATSACDEPDTDIEVEHRHLTVIGLPVEGTLYKSRWVRGSLIVKDCVQDGKGTWNWSFWRQAPLSPLISRLWRCTYCGYTENCRRWLSSCSACCSG